MKMTFFSILCTFFIYTQVARVLNRRLFAIQCLWRKYQMTGSVADLPKRPKRRVTTYRQDRHIIVSHLRDRFLPAATTARQTPGTHGRPVTPQTVRNRLREVGVRCRRPKKGVILTRRHRAARLAWARRHMRLTRVDWANVLFTDESRITLRNADGRRRVYRRRGERFSANCVAEADRFQGGSIMIWGGISLHTKTAPVVIRGNLNALRFQQTIVQPVLVPMFNANRGMRLLQDNATCHVARTTTNMLQANRIQVMQFPAKSPDLNPIEHVWDLLKRRVHALPQQHDLNALERDVIRVWTNITQHDLRPFVTSMRKRCQACIAANGGHTKY